MSRPLVNPAVRVEYKIGRVISGRERTGWQALVVDPERWSGDTREDRLFRKMPVWKCPHAHTSETGAQLCGEVWIKRRLADQRAVN